MTKEHQQLHATLLLLEAEGMLSRYMHYTKELGITPPRKALEKVMREEYAHCGISSKKVHELIAAAMSLADRLKVVRDERELLFPECQELIAWLNAHYSLNELVRRVRPHACTAMANDVMTLGVFRRVKNGQFTQRKSDRPGKEFWLFGAEQALFLREALKKLKAAVLAQGSEQPPVYNTVKGVLQWNYNKTPLRHITRLLAIHGIEISEGTVCSLRSGRFRTAKGGYIIREEKAQAILEALILGLAPKEMELPQAAD